MQEEHVDQRLGPGAITEATAGFRPEALMRRREGPSGSGPGQGGGTGKGARL
jgi:hypothetical protein